MKLPLLLLSAALLAAGPTACAEAPRPPAGLALVYALTDSTQHPPVTTIYLHDIASGERQLAYCDSDEPSRVLVKIAASDLLGAARAIPPADIYLVMGPPSAPGPPHTDALCRLRLTDPQQTAPQPLLPLPLCFSQASPYPLWNRAPTFALSPDASRVALAVLRIGDTAMERPAILILSLLGVEEWRLLLEHRDLYVADLAWSPDGKSLAYLVMPLGDEHTLDENLLPKAGIYLADVASRTTRLLQHCYADLITWGPTQDRITLAARVGDFWGAGHVLRIFALPSGRKLEEISLPGWVSALTYSDDQQWLAFQTTKADRHQVWIQPAAEGWPRLAFELPADQGRLSLLGWARQTPP